MNAKSFSILMEMELRKLNNSMYGKSDELLCKPYETIISALEYRVSQEKYDNFKMYYQSISGKKLQELIDENYNVEQLLKDLRILIEEL